MTEQPSAYLARTSREYALYINQTRAIPLIHDGLKEGQRIALWLLRNEASKIKTAALTGKMMESLLYVHGDASAATAINLLAAPFKNNVPLIEGLGQFGNRKMPDGEGIGAPRYTDVKRAKASDAILYQDLDLIPMEENYDGSRQKPQYFLPLIPLVLLNGVNGVGYGHATSILPHDLQDIIGATEDALHDRPIREMMPKWERYNVTVTATNKPNQYEILGRAEVLDASTIRVTELPPGMTVDAIRDRLDKMEEAKEIVRFVDRSAKTIDITVTLPRGSARGWTEQKALDFLKIKERVTERIVVVDWDRNGIRTFDNAADLVKEFAAWRLRWYKVRFERMRDMAKRELDFWLVIEALLENGFLSRLGKHDNRKAVEDDVRSVETAVGITLDDRQIDRVVSMPTYRWTRETEAEAKSKIAELRSAVADYEVTISDPDRLKKVYLGELAALKKAKL
jgi:DNA gyrase/topoisomerase IV subunit A